jgi:DNA-binding transcriptional MerR regulator
MSEPAYLRIGELSRRTGVSPELLRAWERRYALLRPQRTDGGFRLYSHEDLLRVEAMRAHLARGVSAAQAARLAADSPQPAAGPAPTPRPVGVGGAAPEVGGPLQEALDALDDAGAQAAFDNLLARYGVDSILRDVILPYLHDLGQRWSSGAASVAQEHFASALLRGRLLGLARGWDQGNGPRAVLACGPGELHDLSLIVFGLALRRHGWRITYLGADTPIQTITETARALEPDIVVLVAVATALDDEREALAALAAQRPLALAGSAVTGELAASVGARRLAGDPVTEAERLAPALPR